MIKYFPIFATILIDLANIGHIQQMFREQSAAGQSLLSYVMILGALFMWEAFYRVRTPDEKAAIWSARIGIAFILMVMCTVIYFRYS